MSSVMKGITSIFKPKIPSVSTPRLPDPGSFAQKQAARQEVQDRKKKRGGRDSTIYTGGAYSGSNLGGTA